MSSRRRNKSFQEAWISDRYDSECHHLLMIDADGLPIAAVRIALAGRWPLEDRYKGPMHKDQGAEFGRLGIARHSYEGKQTLHELMLAACNWCVALNRPLIYGLTIAPFWTAMHKMGVPLSVLSETIRAYGEDQNVILFDARQLIGFYEAWITRRLEAVSDVARLQVDR